MVKLFLLRLPLEISIVLDVLRLHEIIGIVGVLSIDELFLHDDLWPELHDFFLVVIDPPGQVLPLKLIVSLLIGL